MLRNSITRKVAQLSQAHDEAVALIKDAIKAYDKHDLIIIALGRLTDEARGIVQPLIAHAVKGRGESSLALGSTFESLREPKAWGVSEEEMLNVFQLTVPDTEYLKTIELSIVEQMETIRKDFSKSIFIVDRYFTETAKANGHPVSEVYRYAARVDKVAIFNIPFLESEE